VVSGQQPSFQYDSSFILIYKAGTSVSMASKVNMHDEKVKESVCSTGQKIPCAWTVYSFLFWLWSRVTETTPT